MSMETNSLAWKRLWSRRSLGVKWCREWMLTGIRRGGLSTVLASVYVVCCSFVCGQHWSVSANKMCKEADLLTDGLLVNTATINLLRPLNDAFPFCVPCLVTTVTVYTRSFSVWSIVCIELTLTTTTPPPPPVSEMAVKSMGTNEIKLLGGPEEQMIFLWLITHCKRICAGHITSESVSLPRPVSSG